MADTVFDSGGLSAVTTFFGGETSQSSQLHDASEKKNAFSPRLNRIGLGAESIRKLSNIGQVENDGTLKKILSVGRKRNRNEGDDSDVEECSVCSNDEDDSEDEGRTTAIKNRKRVSISKDNIKEETKKATKAGKKERLLAKKMKEKLDADSTKQTTESPSSNVTLVVKKNKRKKPKIRSRQKNIRKDTRNSGQKPDNLILGKGTFNGRPLTKETREYLKLPDKFKTTGSLIRQNLVYGNTEEIEPSESSFINGHVGLGVDGLLDNQEDHTISTGSKEIIPTVDVTVGLKKGLKKKKKKKHSKYKNLSF